MSTDQNWTTYKYQKNTLPTRTVYTCLSFELLTTKFHICLLHTYIEYIGYFIVIFKYHVFLPILLQYSVK